LLRVSQEQGRIFVTRDRDFGGLVFLHGSAKTILVIAVKNAGVAWYEPLDLTFHGARLSLDRDSTKQRVELAKCFILTADSSVRYMADNPAEEVLTADHV
jgi:hypothetical protein